jgi:anti-anti-sigma factor
MKDQKIQIYIPANLHYSSLVRHMAEEFFGYVGFSKEWSGRLKLVVDELFMNAVKYGSTEDISTVKIIFSYHADEAQFLIEDDGSGTKKVSAATLIAMVSANANDGNVTKTSGRGLAMISGLWTDKLQIADSDLGGIKVVFAKKVDSTKPQPPPMVQAMVDRLEKSDTESKILEKMPIQDKKPAGPEVLIRLEGEIDQSNIERLTLPVSDSIDAIPVGGQLVIDFAGITYINSTVIGHLAEWHNRMESKKGILVLKSANKEVREVLDLVGLGKVLNFKD